MVYARRTQATMACYAAVALAAAARASCVRAATVGFNTWVVWDIMLQAIVKDPCRLIISSKLLLACSAGEGTYALGI